MNLPFSVAQFLGVFEAYNRAVWPAQLVLVALALAVLARVWRRRDGMTRWVPAALGGLWLWMGVVYHWGFFARINGAAWGFGALFVLEAGLFFHAASAGRGLRIAFTSRGARILSAAFAGYALLIYPVLGHLAGHGYPQAPTFGLPCPTTIFTLAILVAFERPAARRLVVIPVAWSLLGFSAALQLGIHEDLGLLVAGALAAAFLFAPRRRDPHASPRPAGPEGGPGTGDLGVDPGAAARLPATRMLDFGHPAIADLVRRRGWAALGVRQRIGAVYGFCRNDVRFGYNRDGDDIPASEVLAEGLGQCNTKATLLLALLRAVGVRGRLRAATVDRRMQKGAVGWLPYLFMPREILHTWVQVFFDGRWLDLEGVILDEAYLRRVQDAFREHRGPFSGYAVGTEDLQAPRVCWNGQPTHIQRTAVVRDLGVFDCPDTFYATHGTNLGPVKARVYRAVLQPIMNARVRTIRGEMAPARRPAAGSGAKRPEGAAPAAG